MRLAACALLLLGCSSLRAFSTPPSQPHQLELYSHEARYELLNHVSAKACAQDDELKAIKDTKSSDPRAIGPGYLFERAKYEALEKIPTADGLLAIRAKVDLFENGLCTTITGRAYRITHLAAVPPARDNEPAQDGAERSESEKMTPPNDEL